MLLKTSQEWLAEVEKDMTKNASGIEALQADVTVLKADVAELRVHMDRRFEAMDQKMDRRLDTMDRKFWWLVGVMIASQAATITVVATIVRAAVAN